MRFFVMLASFAAVVAADKILNCDCSGTQSCDYDLKFDGSVSEKPVSIPGQLQFSVNIKNSRVLPSDTLLIKTVTRDSDSYIVPCLDGIAGSCTIELCDLIASFPDVTQCPLSPGELNIRDNINFDEIWFELYPLAEVDHFTARYQFQSDEHVYGCATFPFSLNRTIQQHQ